MGFGLGPQKVTHTKKSSFVTTCKKKESPDNTSKMKNTIDNIVYLVKKYQLHYLEIKKESKMNRSP